MPKSTVLVVDDEPDLCELLSITLQRMNLIPRTAHSVADAQRLLKTAVRALKLGAFDFVSKPLDLAGLRKLVASAIRLSETLDSDTSVFGPRLLGMSAAMQHMREMIGRVARSQAPVHICGESGTGKELVAKLIHESGPRRDGPFVPVNCGAIPTELMESELFGHKRGSFTGAIADKRGLIQSAEGGTLFLDEIADLPLHMQVKLLRVIQEKAVRPLGEQSEVQVDVRILSATHKNLSTLVAEGKFREDLFYRVNVIELRVPSLRERREDVPELAEAILRRLGRRMKTSPLMLGKDALAAFESYTFPGNVRELENILERAITLSTGGEISARDIQLRPTRDETLAGTIAQNTGALGNHLEDIERDAIQKALEKTRYNKTAAAKILGMSFRALRYRIKKLGIE
jgi:two-component system, NtrC family, response regulator PilR